MEFKENQEELRPLLQSDQDFRLAEITLKVLELRHREEEFRKAQRPVNPLIALFITSAVSIVSIVIGKYFEKRQQTEQIRVQVEQQRAKLESDLLLDAMRDTSQTRVIQRLDFLLSAGILSQGDRAEKIRVMVLNARQNQMAQQAPSTGDSVARPPVSGLSLLTGNQPDAARFEAAGFQALDRQEVDPAILAFGQAEQSLNGYHSVYEIAGYLKRHRKELQSRTPGAWDTLYQQLLSSFSYGMTEAQKTSFRQKLQPG